MTMGQIKCKSVHTAFVKTQPPAIRSIQHLDGSRKKWDIPHFAAQIDLKKSVRPCGQKPSNERTRSRQTAPGMDPKTVVSTQFTNEAVILRVKKSSQRQRAPARNARKPHGVHTIGRHSAGSAGQNMVEQRDKIGFRLNETHFPSVAYADDIAVMATSTMALERIILDLTENFKENGLWRLAMRKQTGSQRTCHGYHGQKAGDAKVARVEKLIHVLIFMSLAEMGQEHSQLAWKQCKTWSDQLK